MTLHGSVYSSVLGFHTGISVLTPDRFLEKGSYRVMYLLHGLHGNNQTWINNTMMASYAGAYNSIFIMPEVGRSFYADQMFGYKYYTYIAEELPEIVRSVFNVSAKREDTAVLGCSMGGYGALKIALSKPEAYGFCASISPAFLFVNEILPLLRTDESGWAKKSPSNAAIVRDMYAIFGENLDFKDGDIIFKLAEKASLSKAKPKIYAVCGSRDELIQDNRRFNALITETNLDLDWTFEEWDGVHDWIFFDKSFQKALELWKK